MWAEYIKILLVPEQEVQGRMALPKRELMILTKLIHQSSSSSRVYCASNSFVKKITRKNKFSNINIYSENYN